MNVHFSFSLPLWATLGFLCLPWGLMAVQPQRLVVDSTLDWQKGEADGLTIADPGTVTTGAKVREIAQFGGELLWDAVVMPSSGDLILGTGPQGKVIRLDQKGTPTPLTEFEESDVYAVALSPDQELFVATSPDGKIFRRDRKGEFEPWFEPGEKYIWDLAFDLNGHLLVATGERGKLFRVTGRDEGELIFDAEEPHLRCLAVGDAGQVLVGTTGRGLVYRLDKRDRSVVLMDSGRTDVAALAVGPDGTVFASAVGEQSKSSQPVPAQDGEGKLNIVAMQGLITLNAAETEGNGSKSSKVPTKDSQKVVCEVMRIVEGQAPGILYQGAHEIYALCWMRDALIAGTGENGNLLEIQTSGDLAVLGSTESKQVTALVPDSGGGLFVLSSNWGRVHQIDAEKQTGGSYRSEVIDSSRFAQWGHLRAAGNGKWSVRTRSGNTPEPGRSWFDWKFLEGSRIKSESARYLQFEVTLDRGSIHRMEVTYLPQNEAPEIKQIKALEPNLGFVALPPQPPQPPVQTGSQLLKGESDPNTATDRFRAVEETGLRTLVWEASDPNGDALTFRVEVKEEEGNWQTVATDLTDPVFSWDTRGWPDGLYYARVFASDQSANALDRGLESSKTSEIWRIDHTEPEIRLISEAEKALRFEVIDQGGILQAVSFSTNGRDYRTLVPEDGILDSASETFQVERSRGQPVYLRARDENGNIAGFHLSPQ